MLYTVPAQIIDITSNRQKDDDNNLFPSMLLFYLETRSNRITVHIYGSMLYTNTGSRVYIYTSYHHMIVIWQIRLMQNVYYENNSFGRT